MSSDPGSPIPRRPPAPTDLPRITQLSIRRVPFDAPRLRHFESSLSRYKEAVELTVEVDGPIPTRGYGPALFIGDVEVSHSERLGATTWRFLAFEPQLLKRGAPISWGWMKDPAEQRLRTAFHFQLDGEP
jgi:hypothetical protein